MAQQSPPSSTGSTTPAPARLVPKAADNKGPAITDSSFDGPTTDADTPDTPDNVFNPPGGSPNYGLYITFLNSITYPSASSPK